MITKTINLYEYSELSEEAKDRIRNEWREGDNIMDAYNSDYEAVLKKFSDICSVNVFDWSVGLYGSHFRFDCEGYPYEVYDSEGYVDEYIELASLSGKLLFRYVLNNIIPYIINGKYYGKLVNDATAKHGCRHVKRYSGVIMEDEVEKGSRPLTGYYADCDIIKPIIKYYRAWTTYPADYTYEDLMKECLNAFFDVWEQDYEYQDSDEAIDEMIEANWSDNLYFEDGTEYTGELEVA